VHAHFGGDGWLVARSAARLGVPLIVTLHGLDVTRQAQRPGPRGARHRRHLRAVFDRAAVVLAVSEVIRRTAVDLGADPAKVIVHHTGVPVPSQPATAAKRWDVVFVGRFVEKKGLDDLVEALALVGDLRPRVLFVGAGPLEEPIRARAAGLGLDATFLGMRPPAEVARHLGESKILVSPSKKAPDGDCEGLPTTILEAAALGVPTVSTRHSGIPEAVLHGVTGLLGAEGDRVALADGMRRLLTDDALRSRLGDAARRHVQTHFDVAAQCRRLERLYEAAVAGTVAKR
jgi:glycosyltransferase involved in cell wall biosynthesis